MSVIDKLRALASDLSAEGLPSIARRIDAILDAEQDETADPLKAFIAHCRTRAGEFVAPGCMASAERASWLATAAKAAAFSESLAAPSASPGTEHRCLRCGVSWTAPVEPCPQCDAPEGQPEGSEHEHVWERHQNVTTRGYVMSPYEACKCGAARPAAPAPVPVHNHPPYRPPCNERVLADGSLRGACMDAPVPDDEDVGLLAGLIVDLTDEPMWSAVVIAKDILDAGWVSPDAHAQAVRDALRALAERIAGAIEAIHWRSGLADAVRDLAARIAREAVR